MTTMTGEDAQRRVSDFLTRQLAQALQAVDYDRPAFDAAPGTRPTLREAARARVASRHVDGASDAFYLVEAFGDALMVQIQLNVDRFVVVYRIPAVDGVDAEALRPRFAMWQRGAANVGWELLWRDAARPDEADQPYVEIYCYARAAPGFLLDEVEQLFWRTDIAQMTRSLMLEAHRLGVRLSPREAGYRI